MRRILAKWSPIVRILMAALMTALLFACSAGTAIAQEENETQIEKKEVPAAVLAAFAKAFPKATVKGYTREVEDGQTKYEVECVEGKTHRDVTFTPDGTLLLVEESIEMKDVPEVVRQALAKKYPNAKIELAEKLMDGKTVEFEFHWTGADGKEVEAKFDAKGNELKT